MPSTFKLYYYCWTPGRLSTTDEIQLSPDITVKAACKQMISEHRPADAELYVIPEQHPVDLDNLPATLGTLSLSCLGSPLSIGASLASIFTDHPNPGRLHLVLVDPGSYWLRLEHIAVNLIDRQILQYFLLASWHRY